MSLACIWYVRRWACSSPRRKTTFSLLRGVLSALHIAALALANLVVFIHGLEAWSLAAVPRSAHHVFAQGAALLNRCLQVLVRLLLDGLGVL